MFNLANTPVVLQFELAPFTPLALPAVGLFATNLRKQNYLLVVMGKTKVTPEQDKLKNFFKLDELETKW